MGAIRPLTLDDAPALAHLCAANREFLAPWEAERDESFFSVAGQVGGSRRPSYNATKDSRRPT